MEGPLAGVRVAEFCSTAAGPYCAMFWPLTATFRYLSLAPSEPALRALSWIRFWMYCGEIA